MSEQSQINTRQPISDGWGCFHSDNYHNPAPHDEQAERRAQLAFAYKTEATIRGMFPETLAGLAHRWETFPGVDVASVLRSAAAMSSSPLDDEYLPACFYSYTLARYKEVQSPESPDLLDFGLFVRDFQLVANPIWENLKQFPADFFNLYHQSRDRLFEHLYEVIVDLLADHLQSLQDAIDRFWTAGGPGELAEVEVFRWAFTRRFVPPMTSDPQVARLKDLIRRCDFEPVNGFLGFEDGSDVYPLDFLPAQINQLLSDVVRVGDATGERIVLTAEERATALGGYAVLTEVATYYLTEFAPTQADLVTPRPFLTPTCLADILLLPFKDAMRFVWDGKVVSDLRS